MELIRTIRERYQTKHQEELQRQAEDLITLSDFDNTLYFAYAGTPFVPIQKDWTSKEIAEELGKLRQNYINIKSKVRKLSLPNQN